MIEKLIVEKEIEKEFHKEWQEIEGTFGGDVPSGSSGDKKHGI